MRYFLERGLMRFLCRIFLPRNIHVTGMGRVPLRGGVLVVGNHFGTIDPPLTGALLARRDVHYMAKSESFQRGWQRWLLTGYNAFPVVRGKADRSALRHAIALLRDGHVVFLYPEGSRSGNAEMQRPHAGAGFLARQTGAMIVPVAIWGSENVLPKGARWPHRNPVNVHFGEPFRLGAATRGAPKLGNQEAADLMMRRVADLLPEQHRGVFRSDAALRASSPPAA